MYYYYAYYYGASKMGKINIELNFKEINGEAVSLEMLMDFMNTINELHKRVVFLTQPEYKNAGQDLDQIDKASLLSYHELQIENISSGNSFVLKMSFTILTGGTISYWAFWKIIIQLCKRYGKDTKDLSKTVASAFDDLCKISYNLKQLLDKIKSNKNFAIDNNHEKKLYSQKLNQMKELVLKALQNKSFKEYYNKICLTSIGITNFISNFEPENYVKSENFEDIIYSEIIEFIKNAFSEIKNQNEK